MTAPVDTQKVSLALAIALLALVLGFFTSGGGLSNAISDPPLSVLLQISTADSSSLIPLPAHSALLFSFSVALVMVCAMAFCWLMVPRHRIVLLVFLVVVYLLVTIGMEQVLGPGLTWIWPLSATLFAAVFLELQLRFAPTISRSGTPHSLDANYLQMARAYQQQGLLDAAYDYYRRCEGTPDIGKLVYLLAEQFERNALYGKAYEAFMYSAGLTDDTDAAVRARSNQELLTRQLGIADSAAIELSAKGTEFGPYRLTSILGHGAMGIVYAAIETATGREVALKTIQPPGEISREEQDEILDRFNRELASARRLHHPGIVRIVAAGEISQRAFIAMDRLAGHDLTRYCDPEYLLPVDQVLHIAVQCALALDYAHTQNVVHRDIKPANIMYDPASGTVKITDFGIARIMDASKTRTGTVLGTPDYMSPEQCEGLKVDGRADLFSLGVVLYQLICGELPFKGRNMAALMAAIVREPPLDMKPDVDPAIVKVIHNAMAKKPQKRYQSGARLAEHLRVCQQRSAEIAGAGVLTSEITTE